MPLGHRAAEKAAGEQIDDRRQVQLAPARVDLCETAAPDEAGLLGGEVPVHEVRGSRLCNVPGWMPRSSATSGIGFPVSVTIRTAPSRNSAS